MAVVGSVIALGEAAAAALASAGVISAGGVAAAAVTGAVSGALIGGGVAAVTGGDIGKGILMGGLTGGIGGGVMNLIGGPAGAAAGGTQAAAGEVQSIAQSLQVANPALTAQEAMAAAQTYAQSGYTAAQMAQAATAQSLINAVPGLTTQSAMNWAAQGYTAADMANIAAQGVSIADLNAAAAQFPTQAGLIGAPAGAPAVAGPSPIQQAASQAAKGLLNTGNPMLDRVLGIGLAAAPSALAYNAATKSYIDPSQYVVDPLTGKVVSSSVVTPAGTTTSLDPRVTQLQEQVGAGLTPIQTNLQNLYTQAGQGAGGYVQSVVDPLTAQAAGEYGKLVSGMGARGLSGSSLAGQALANFTTDTGRAIADARSKAVMESLGLQRGLTTDMLAPLTAKQQLAGQIADVNLYAMGRGATGAAAGATQAQQQQSALGRALSGMSTALGVPYALTP